MRLMVPSDRVIQGSIDESQGSINIIRILLGEGFMDKDYCTGSFRGLGNGYSLNLSSNVVHSC